MKIFIYSDSHFGHNAMVEYCGRPENHSEIIEAELRALPDDCMLIHLGDICIGNDALWHEAIESLPYKKILVRGNHDHKSNSWYMTHGWDFVCDRFTWNLHGKNIIFSHRPVRIGEYSVNIHGHFHNSLEKVKDGMRKHDTDDADLAVLTDRHFLYSPEIEKYKPLLLDKIINGRLRDGSNDAAKVKA